MRTAPRQLIRIDQDTGNRSLVFSWSSLTCSRPDGEPPLALVPQAGYPRMWRHPSERWLVLELNGAFVLYDPTTDNSNLLSC